MRFKIINAENYQPNIDRNIIYLRKQSWDDWFVFSTLYSMEYIDQNGNVINIGSTKIGRKGMKGAKYHDNLPRERYPLPPDEFNQIPADFFSVGQSADFYKILTNLSASMRSEILEELNDIAFSEDIYRLIIDEEVTKVSLLRDVTRSSITGQFRRLALGESVLSHYSFTYTSQKRKESEPFIMRFEVKPKSNPPSNVQVIIGRNGVGKTSLLNGMINSLLEPDTPQKRLSNGFFQVVTSEGEDKFANLISVSFSAFDDTEPINEKRDVSQGMRYSYIGLKKPRTKDGKKQSPKSPYILGSEFIDSLEACIKLDKIDIWRAAMRILSSDQIFEDSKVVDLYKIIDDDDGLFEKESRKRFTKLSSGHRIVLLTITKLVEKIEEKSLVLLDEPEGHLHPPLLSAFVRVISKLMIHRNGVAIIATHSPVVLQEVPKSCAWKLSRHGGISKAEKLNQETFAENVGLLTNEVFGLELRRSGYHKLISEYVIQAYDFHELMKMFNNEIGAEGQVIARTLLLMKTEGNEEN